MVESWVDGRGWNEVKRKLPKGYRWERQLAKRKNRRGRPMGGIIIGVKEEIGETVINKGGEKEGVLAVQIKIGGEIGG